MANLKRVFDKATTGTAIAEIFASAIKGKTILVTGTNKDGIGGKMVEILSAHSPKTLILASRTPSKIQDIIDSWKANAPATKYIAVPLDLSSQKSCREAASSLLSNPDIQQIDLVFNNAGVMNIPERQLSPEGIEMQFATNHIGHFLFTNLIMPKILVAAKTNPKGATRIVNVSSAGTAYSPVRFSDINFNKTMESLPKEEQVNDQSIARGVSADPKLTYHPRVAYGQSKTANILFSLGLTARLYEKYGILSYGIHPGAILTELTRHMEAKEIEDVVVKFKDFLVTLDQGCATSLRAGLDESLEPADYKGDGEGIYLAEASITQCPAWSRNPKMAEKLWELSEKLVGEKFEY